MSSAEFESAFPTVEWPQKYALHRTASGITQIKIDVMESRCESKCVIFRCVQWRTVLGTCTKEGREFVIYFSNC
jgi:hypothetical protein